MSVDDWISVKDQLPPKDMDQETDWSITVLITDGKNIGIGYYEFEYFADDPTAELQYESDSWNDDTHIIDDVTHWMPLPKPPEM